MKEMTLLPTSKKRSRAVSEEVKLRDFLIQSEFIFNEVLRTFKNAIVLKIIRFKR